MLIRIFKNLISIIMIAIIIAFTFQQYKKHNTIYNEELNIDDYYYDVNKIERNDIGLFDEKNTKYIKNAENIFFKDEILDLIKNYNNGEYKDFNGDYRDSVENYLKDNNTIFIGDSNVKHFLYYDLLDESYYIEFEGKNIKEQSELIKYKINKDIKNVILFNGYNLDVFDDSQDYVYGYIKLVEIIKEIVPDCKIYICSLLPATKEVIYEDFESPFPKKIYNGKKFDMAIQNYNFDDATYVDTKWMVKDDMHKADGVHMNKTFYEAFIPFMTYYTLLYSDYKLDKINNNTDETNSDNLNNLNTPNTPNTLNFVYKEANKNLVGEDDIYYYDSDEQWNLLIQKYGENALKVLQDSIFIGDSHMDRLLRSIMPKLTAICKPKRTLRQLEEEINFASIMGKEYIVLYTGNNEYVFNTDLNEYEYEYRYIHDLVKNGNVKKVFVCSYFRNVKGVSYRAKTVYDDVIKKVCDEYDNLHYIDLSGIWKNEYITDDNHLSFRFNNRAIEIVLKEMNNAIGNDVEVLNDIDIVSYNEKMLYGDVSNLSESSVIDTDSNKDESIGIISSENNTNETIKMGKIKDRDIEWIVIDKNNNEKTLLSKYIYLSLPYNDIKESVTWESSSLRKYLNNEFYNNAFNEDEKKKIKKSKVENPVNEHTDQKGGNDTYDYVYIPSIQEMNKYIDKETEDNKKVKLATKCINIDDNNNIFVNKSKGKWYEGNSPYWLRTPGLYDYDAAYVNYNGEISFNGVKVSYDQQGVRLMIKIEEVE